MIRFTLAALIVGIPFLQRFGAESTAYAGVAVVLAMIATEAIRRDERKQQIAMNNGDET